MDFQMTKEQKDIRQAARDFAEKEIRDIAHEYDQREEFPRELWKKACGLGFVGVFLNEAYQGHSSWSSSGGWTRDVDAFCWRLSGQN
jgi:alkylation response protein AidB-like acyl-CoA dehydrogenase